MFNVIQFMVLVSVASDIFKFEVESHSTDHVEPFEFMERISNLLSIGDQLILHYESGKFHRIQSNSLSQQAHLGHSSKTNFLTAATTNTSLKENELKLFDSLLEGLGGKTRSISSLSLCKSSQFDADSSILYNSRYKSEFTNFTRRSYLNHIRQKNDGLLAITMNLNSIDLILASNGSCNLPDLTFLNIEANESSMILGYTILRDKFVMLLEYNSKSSGTKLEHKLINSFFYKNNLHFVLIIGGEHFRSPKVILIRIFISNSSSLSPAPSYQMIRLGQSLNLESSYSRAGTVPIVVSFNPSHDQVLYYSEYKNFYSFSMKEIENKFDSLVKLNCTGNSLDLGDSFVRMQTRPTENLTDSFSCVDGFRTEVGWEFEGNINCRGNMQGADYDTIEPTLKAELGAWGEFKYLKALRQGPTMILVLFLGTEKGDLRKLVRTDQAANLSVAHPTFGQLFYLNNTSIFGKPSKASDSTEAATTFYQENGKSLYIGEGTSLAKLDFNSCSNNNNCIGCYNDPLNCVWCGHICLHKSEGCKNSSMLPTNCSDDSEITSFSPKFSLTNLVRKISIIGRGFGLKLPLVMLGNKNFSVISYNESTIEFCTGIVTEPMNGTIKISYPYGSIESKKNQTFLFERFTILEDSLEVMLEAKQGCLGSSITLYGGNFSQTDKSDWNMTIGGIKCGITKFYDDKLSCCTTAILAGQESFSVIVEIGGHRVAEFTHSLEANVIWPIVAVFVATISLVLFVLLQFYLYRRALEEQKASRPPVARVPARAVSNDYEIQPLGPNNCYSSDDLDKMQAFLGDVKIVNELLEQFYDQPLLGDGEFGQIYEGKIIWNIGDKEEKVAIKILRTKFLNDPIICEKFLYEALIMKKLRHTNVIPLVGVTFNMTSQLKLIMPLMGHGNLQSHICKNSSHLSRATLFKFAHQIAIGMDYISKQGYLHRDLAARNCLLDENDIIKIADFGLATELATPDSVYNAIKCKWRANGWTAIEGLEHQKWSRKSDVWSFGVVLWELFNPGLIPYKGITPEYPCKEPGIDTQDLIEYLKIEGKRLEPLHCPKEFYEQIMLECWQIEPEDRPEFEQLVAELEQILIDIRDDERSNRCVNLSGYCQD